MLISALAFREKIPNRTYYSDYAVLALTTRWRWEQVKDGLFRHTSGAAIHIETEDSVKAAVKKIVVVEVDQATRHRTDGERLLEIALTEVERVFAEPE